MDCAGYENPCIQDKDSLAIGGDSETLDMKTLFEICYERFPNEPLSKQRIQGLISEEEIFRYFDFTKRSDQVKFGNKIIKFIGRQLSGITMKVEDLAKRKSRYEYIFTKDIVETNKSNIFGNQIPLVLYGNLGQSLP